MNGFLIRDAGDVEKQELFIERLGDFIIPKHLPLEHRRSDAAANSDGDRAGEQIEGRTTHEVKELPFAMPDDGSCGRIPFAGPPRYRSRMFFPRSYSANHAGAYN